MKITKKRYSLLSLVTLFGVMAAGCQSHPISSSPRISGHVTRAPSVSLAQGEDGKGTVFIAAFSTCKLGEPLAGFDVVPNANLQTAGASVPFSIKGLKSGTYYLTAFFDENGDASQKAPRPGPTDLVHAPSGIGDGTLDCVTANMGENDVMIPLTGLVPSIKN